MRTRGSRLLAVALAEGGVTRAEIGRWCRVTVRAVGHWANGDRIPQGWHEREALNARLGIPPRSWDELDDGATKGTRVPQHNAMVGDVVAPVEHDEIDPDVLETLREHAEIAGATPTAFLRRLLEARREPSSARGGEAGATYPERNT